MKSLLAIVAGAAFPVARAGTKAISASGQASKRKQEQSERAKSQRSAGGTKHASSVRVIWKGT